MLVLFKTICFFFVFHSAWVKSEEIYDYVQYRHEFSSKNSRKIFQEAVQQADQAIMKEAQQQQPCKSSTSHEAAAVENFEKITLKARSIDYLLKTFDDNEADLRILFDERRRRLDRFNHGNGYDFLTVLSRIATSEQQQQMYCRMTDAFGIKNLQYENLIWTILLPEWLIAICGKKFSKSKDEIITQIKNDEQNSFDANDSFDFEL